MHDKIGICIMLEWKKKTFGPWPPLAIKESISAQSVAKVVIYLDSDVEFT